MRTKVFAFIAFFFFGILIFGLFYTQALKYEYYKGLSERNRIRVIPLEAPRGKIYDRSGRLLVSNRIAFDVEVIFQEIKDENKTVDLLSGILAIDRRALEKKIDAARKRPFAPAKIAKDIEKEKAIRVEEISLDLPGVIVTTRPLRNYLYKNSLSHVTGYIGKISEPELAKYKVYGYRMQDFVGKDGIERAFNDYLRGVDGGLQVEVDSRGRQINILAIKEARQGRNLYLTIDIELQEFCHELLKEKTGAIVVMDPSTGAILALVSQPDFDPNAFVSPQRSGEVSRLLNDSGSFPMINRAISGTYPPGSVFKIAVFAAALDTGKFNDTKTFFCDGSHRVGNRVFHCWKEEGHGAQNVRNGIKNSCNVFFCQLGLFLGVDEISKYAFKMGLGRPAGIDLPGEVSGLVPTPSWKRRKLKQSWFKGETANYAIGQGYLLVTPLQIVRFLGAIASGGNLPQPYVVERIEDIKSRRTEAEDTGIRHKVLEALKVGLGDVINAKGGTGYYARSKEVIIAGKTGTAQNPHGDSHAWFAGFAPIDDPRICVVVFIEQGGKGGLAPARSAKKIIEETKKLGLL